MSNITKIQYQDKEIILIATAHVSIESVNEVRETIELEKPDSICIELDQERYNSMMNPEKWKNQDIVQVIKQKKVGYLLVNLILSSFQKKIAKDMNTTAGMEMLEGIKLAKENNINLVLADRNIQLTFTRIWRTLSFFEKVKLLSSLIVSLFDRAEISEEEIEELKTQDMLESALKEIGTNFPNIKKVLVDERDQYLAYMIQNASGNKIVAILGAAHTIGIKKIINEPLTIDGLTDLPPKSKAGSLLGWIIPIIIVSMIIASFMLSPSLGNKQLLNWVLINGSASALGCALMLAHPLTILVALICSPFSALAPALSIGMLTGLTEASIHKPKVQDFENLSEDALTFKGFFFRNRVSRILLIFFVSNLFSTIATFISAFNIFGSLVNHL